MVESYLQKTAARSRVGEKVPPCHLFRVLLGTTRSPRCGRALVAARSRRRRLLRIVSINDCYELDNLPKLRASRARARAALRPAARPAGRARGARRGRGRGRGRGRRRRAAEPRDRDDLRRLPLAVAALEPRPRRRHGRLPRRPRRRRRRVRVLRQPRGRSAARGGPAPRRRVRGLLAQHEHGEFPRTRARRGAAAARARARARARGRRRPSRRRRGRRGRRGRDDVARRGRRARRRAARRPARAQAPLGLVLQDIGASKSFRGVRIADPGASARGSRRALRARHGAALALVALTHVEVGADRALAADAELALSCVLGRPRARRDRRAPVGRQPIAAGARAPLARASTTARASSSAPGARARAPPRLRGRRRAGMSTRGRGRREIRRPAAYDQKAAAWRIARVAHALVDVTTSPRAGRRARRARRGAPRVGQLLRRETPIDLSAPVRRGGDARFGLVSSEGARPRQRHRLGPCSQRACRFRARRGVLRHQRRADQGRAAYADARVTFGELQTELPFPREDGRRVLPPTS